MCDERELCRLPGGGWVVVLAILIACNGTAVKGDGSGGAGAAGHGGAGAAGHGGGGAAGHGGGGTAGHAGAGTGGRGGGGSAGRSGVGAAGGAPGGSSGAGGHGGAGGTPGPGSPCASDNDCRGLSASFLMCQAPDESRGCAICQTTTGLCASDTDCPSDPGAPTKQICEVAPSSACYCRPTKICQQGCRTNDDCTADQACNPGHHCQTICVPGSCPVDFTCGDDSFCFRTTCTTDAQCSAACVEGACYDRPGTCFIPPV